MNGRDNKEETKVRISGMNFGGSVTITGLSEDCLNQVQAMALGQSWMTVQDGKAIFRKTTEELPDPVEDSELLPFWRQNSNPVDQKEALKEFSFDEEGIGSSHPSFMIQSLCGYNFNPESYRANAQALESYGFVCMRSQRDKTGKYWEIWYLSGRWTAKGGLKEFIEKKDSESSDIEQRSQEEVANIVSFLCRHVSFGTLDVVAQRAAACID